VCEKRLDLFIAAGNSEKEASDKIYQYLDSHIIIFKLDNKPEYYVDFIKGLRIAYSSD
jgi:hypothetical protein